MSTRQYPLSLAKVINNGTDGSMEGNISTVEGEVKYGRGNRSVRLLSVTSVWHKKHFLPVITSLMFKIPVTNLEIKINNKYDSLMTCSRFMEGDKATAETSYVSPFKDQWLLYVLSVLT
jgi:hypothetical protein